MLKRHVFRFTYHKFKPYLAISSNEYLSSSKKWSDPRTSDSVSNRSMYLSSFLGKKMFYETENQFVFDIVSKDSVNDIMSVHDNRIKDETNLNLLLSQNWRNSNATDIINAVKNAKHFCIDNQIPISDSRFNSLVDGVMDHCEKLSDAELYELLLCLYQYPQPFSISDHNFHDLWSCLDDICCWKLHSWDIDTIFKFADIWYLLNLGKICDFIFEVLNKLPKKADTLTKDQIVHIFFCFNVCRNRPVDFEYEDALQSKISELNVDEMAVVALGYFKSKSSIKLDTILETMILEVTKNSKTIHEISLTAILKVVRFSNAGKYNKQINTMLDHLDIELDRLSDLCCLHIALLGTGLHSYHRNTLQRCSEKLVKNMSNNRLKDIERILNVLTMFDFNPNTNPDIFQAALDELLDDKRLGEKTRYSRSLVSSLNYLSLKGIYSYKLMDIILDKDFIELTYGKSPKFLAREILSLDASIDIECPDYNGNRLTPTFRYKATKWHTLYAPTHDQYKKITALDQLFLDTIDTVKRIVKNDEIVFVDHVLPHFPRADIILCKDTQTGKFVEPIGFQNYIFGDVKVPYNDGSLKWYAIMILGWNNTIKDTSLPLGLYLMKERHLKKIGYNPRMVIWNQFTRLLPEEKEYYISRILV